MGAATSTQPPAAVGGAANAQWNSRLALATPQSVSSWLQSANVEQRRALAQFLTQLGPGAASAEKAAARARQVSGGGGGLFTAGLSGEVGTEVPMFLRELIDGKGSLDRPVAPVWGRFAAARTSHVYP